MNSNRQAAGLTHSSRLHELRHADPERDAARIAHLITCYEFPWDMTRSLEIALFRTFCAPPVSALLDRTGEFGTRAQKRYDDTDLLISELLEGGYDSERGREALRRINHQHGRFQIANEEFLYVLSTFIYEPIRWNGRFGWRLMSDTERLGLFHFWCEVGRRMGICDIPRDYDAFEAFNRQYETEYFCYADSNHRVGMAVLDMFCGWFPGILAPVVQKVILALLDRSVINAFGFPRPSRILYTLVHGSLRLRARLLRILPKRTQPMLRTQGAHRTYPHGYVIKNLGPPDIG